MYLLIFLFLISISLFAQDKLYEPTWESLYQHEATPQWYEDAVLGFYFHWGPYSVPAFGCAGYWLMYMPETRHYELVKDKYGEPGTEFGYKDFVPLWKAPNYDPDEWAELFKYAGADFAGPGAEHHDGFALWDTEFDEWNSYDMGPGIDIVGTLISAIRKQGMRTSVAIHNWRTYITFDTGRRLCPPGVDVNDPKFEGIYGPVHEPTHERPIDNKYPGADWPEEHWQERLDKWKELVDKYKFDLAWWEHMDSGNPPDTLKRQMLAYYFNAANDWGKEVVVTSKKLWHDRRQDLPPKVSPINREIGVLRAPRPQKWQTDIPLGRTWAYTPNVGCKDMDELTDLIVNNVAKNGLTFFSVAPKPDGSLPEEQIEGLKKLGDWMAINKEALYGTTPAPFLLTGTDRWEAGSIRFTQKGEYLYAIDLEKPELPYKIPHVLAHEGSEIKMLGSDKSLKWRQIYDDDDSGEIIIEELPEELPGDYAWSFKIKVVDKTWETYIKEN
ncbi:MAG: alpha-L-fucosidase [Melioribacteraceae bacterium]|nr:alpha-L-fucosidase [Melioribacteraceae bacterium]